MVYFQVPTILQLSVFVMSVLLWFNSIVLVCTMRNSMTSAHERSEMECFVCNSLLGDSCYDSEGMDFSTFAKKCSDYVEVMPNCIFPEGEIPAELKSGDGTGGLVSTMSMPKLSKGLVRTSTTPIYEKVADEVTARVASDGSATWGYQGSMNETSSHPNSSEVESNDEHDDENWGDASTKKVEMTSPIRSGVWEPNATAISQNMSSANNDTAQDVGFTESPNDRRELIRWPNENPFNKRRGDASHSPSYFCYKLVVVARDGEQYIIRGCANKAKVCFTGNFRAVYRYDCSICEGPLCNAHSATFIFRGLLILWWTQMILLVLI